MMSFYEETGEEKERRLKKIRFDMLSAYSSIWDICLAGFLAGQLMFLTGILFLLGTFLISFIFEVGMGATGFLQNVLKASPSESGGSFLTLFKLILSFWPFSLGLGAMGILSSELLRLSRRKVQPRDFFSDRKRITGDLIAFCAVFLVACVVKVTLTIVFGFVTFTLYKLWRYWYVITLGRISTFDAYRVMAEEQK